MNLVRELETKQLAVTRAERDLLFMALVHYADTACNVNAEVWDSIRDKLYATEVDLYEYWDCKGPDDPVWPGNDTVWPLPVSYKKGVAS